MFIKTLGLFFLLTFYDRAISYRYKFLFSIKNHPKHINKLSNIDMDYFNRPGPWDEKNLESLLHANKAWANRMVNEDPNFFEDQVKGHFPKILWIGSGLT